MVDSYVGLAALVIVIWTSTLGLIGLIAWAKEWRQARKPPRHGKTSHRR